MVDAVQSACVAARPSVWALSLSRILPAALHRPPREQKRHLAEGRSPGGLCQAGHMPWPKAVAFCLLPIPWQLLRPLARVQRRREH